MAVHKVQQESQRKKNDEVFLQYLEERGITKKNLPELGLEDAQVLRLALNYNALEEKTFALTWDSFHADQDLQKLISQSPMEADRGPEDTSLKKKKRNRKARKNKKTMTAIELDVEEVDDKQNEPILDVTGESSASAASQPQTKFKEVEPATAENKVIESSGDKESSAPQAEIVSGPGKGFATGEELTAPKPSKESDSKPGKSGQSGAEEQTQQIRPTQRNLEDEHRERASKDEQRERQKQSPKPEMVKEYCQDNKQNSEREHSPKEKEKRVQIEDDEEDKKIMQHRKLLEAKIAKEDQKAAFHHEGDKIKDESKLRESKTPSAGQRTASQTKTVPKQEKKRSIRKISQVRQAAAFSPAVQPTQALHPANPASSLNLEDAVLQPTSMSETQLQEPRPPPLAQAKEAQIQSLEKGTSDSTTWAKVVARNASTQKSPSDRTLNTLNHAEESNPLGGRTSKPPPETTERPPISPIQSSSGSSTSACLPPLLPPILPEANGSQALSTQKEEGKSRQLPSNHAKPAGPLKLRSREAQADPVKPTIANLSHTESIPSNSSKQTSLSPEKAKDRTRIQSRQTSCHRRNSKSTSQVDSINVAIPDLSRAKAHITSLPSPKSLPEVQEERRIQKEEAARTRERSIEVIRRATEARVSIQLSSSPCYPTNGQQSRRSSASPLSEQNFFRSPASPSMSERSSLLSLEEEDPSQIQHSSGGIVQGSPQSPSLSSSSHKLAISTMEEQQSSSSRGRQAYH